MWVSAVTGNCWSYQGVRAAIGCTNFLCQSARAAIQLYEFYFLRQKPSYTMDTVILSVRPSEGIAMKGNGVRIPSEQVAVYSTES